MGAYHCKVAARYTSILLFLEHTMSQYFQTTPTLTGLGLSVRPRSQSHSETSASDVEEIWNYTSLTVGECLNWRIRYEQH